MASIPHTPFLTSSLPASPVFPHSPAIPPIVASSRISHLSTSSTPFGSSLAALVACPRGIVAFPLPPIAATTRNISLPVSLTLPISPTASHQISTRFTTWMSLITPATISAFSMLPGSRHAFLVPRSTLRISTSISARTARASPTMTTRTIASCASVTTLVGRTSNQIRARGINEIQVRVRSHRCRRAWRGRRSSDRGGRTTGKRSICRRAQAGSTAADIHAIGGIRLLQHSVDAGELTSAASDCAFGG